MFVVSDGGWLKLRRPNAASGAANRVDGAGGGDAVDGAIVAVDDGGVVVVILVPDDDVPLVVELVFVVCFCSACCNAIVVGCASVTVECGKFIRIVGYMFDG